MIHPRIIPFSSAYQDWSSFPLPQHPCVTSPISAPEIRIQCGFFSASLGYELHQLRGFPITDCSMGCVHHQRFYLIDKQLARTQLDEYSR